VNWQWFSTKNCQFRKLGTITQRTDAAPVVVQPVDNLAITGIGQRAITATVTSNHSSDYDVIRVGYKKSGSPWVLKEIAGSRVGPAFFWGVNNDFRGWTDIPPAALSTLTFGSLVACQEYTLVAYGFSPGNLSGALLGEVKGRTGTNCHPSDFSALVIANHEDVLEAYSGAIHGHNCSDIDSTLCGTLSILNELLSVYPELQMDYRARIADGEELTSEFDTIEYLEDVHRDIFDAWQSELAVSGWICAVH
jgi:hypothetical protein